MKTRFEVQYQNNNVDTAEIEKIVKKDIKAQGIKLNTIQTMEVYCKPEEASIYYVVTTKKGEVVGNDDPLYLG